MPPNSSRARAHAHPLRALILLVVLGLGAWAAFGSTHSVQANAVVQPGADTRELSLRRIGIGAHVNALAISLLERARRDVLHYWSVVALQNAQVALLRAEQQQLSQRLSMWETLARCETQQNWNLVGR